MSHAFQSLIVRLNTPVLSYDGVTPLCRCSFVNETRKVFVYVNGGTDKALDA